MSARVSRKRHSRQGGADTQHMRVRQRLFDMIQHIARRDELNDTTLAHIVNTSRTRASSLRHGEIHRFNSETLIDILARLGVTVEITIASEQRYARWFFARPRPGWKPPPFTVHDNPTTL